MRLSRGPHAARRSLWEQRERHPRHGEAAGGRQHRRLSRRSGKGSPAMNDNSSESQVIRKQVVPTRNGVVAAQHKRAAQAGAAILEAGGDAIDAAVATSFALGVVEPWMSGITAGGAMVVWRAAEQKAYSIDYGMCSPAALDPA